MRELVRHMVRICGSRKIRLMALIAARVRQIVVSIDVASIARLCKMRAVQWEIRARMTKRGRSP